MQTMGEFTSISDSLALMPDPALQQFAQMHKDDPFTLALAVSESNRRRKLRAAQQGVAGMQPQPTVADQEVAQMTAPAMPEQVGIGALPAPALAGMPAGGIVGEEEMEPQTMAGGGMVAFRDGGDVERYQTGGNIYERHRAMYSRDPRLLGSDPNRPLSESVLEFAPFLSVIPEIFTSAPAPGSELARRREAAAQSSPLEQERARNLATVAASGSPTDPNFRRLPDPRVAGITYDAVSGPAAASAPAAAAAASAPGAPGAPGAPKPPAAAGAPGAGAPGTKPAATPGGLGDLNTLYTNILAGQNYTDPAAAQLRALETKERQAAEAEKADIQRDQAKFAKAFEGREARLAERGAEIGKQKDMNVGLALLNAGFAIMSTPGGLATAIGKGAQVGTQQFAAGLDKIRSAQERLDEARDRMEELKLNRDEMSAKEIRAAESKIRQVGIDAEKRGIDGLRQAAGVNRETAKTLFDKTVQVGATREEIASRERIALMQERGATARANALPGEIRAAMLLGAGETEADKLRSGLPALMELKDRLTDAKIAELYGKHVADSKKDGSIPLSPEEFAKTIKSATGAYRPRVADVEATRER